ncbi:fungal-specific transcription factor domain-containing protein [Mycena rosella]|uniref:Fungal-specific transcription factor domain-containing protein n=1 Tax=Mycena rosella TaxID=1033263 RepID=A0AAD7GKH4_MYCRO|nr:fungal-specific transcription factor domain-containing protein [Mycena rosella]
MFSEIILDMDSNEWASSPPKQRRQGACAVCKKRKIRCDSSETPGNRCSHCTSAGLDCSNADVMKPLASATGYVAALESRIEKLERLLDKLLPGIDLTEHLENDDVVPLLANQAETLPRNDEDRLSDGLGKLKANPERNRFFGKSSGIRLVQTALNFKGHIYGIPYSYPTIPNKRPEFWAPISWLLPPPDESPRYTFPDPDLLTSLVDLYFTEVNSCSPVLHRRTFERKLAENLHIRDHRFAATLLMVCGLGALHSDDPRVLIEGETTRHSAGYKWHSQVSVIPKHLVYKPDLYELQTIALSVMYLMGISKALCWNQVGFGLRRAQDVGAHRRNPYPHSTSQNEEWKRVFWVLLCLEWQLGTMTGRPLAMHDQDFDQELPLECDDEYWDLNFEQPKNKPSEISYFIHHARLLEIQAAVASTIYSPRKPKDISGRASTATDVEIIMAFDSALNSWLLEVPDHLRWDPKRKNTLHFKQSVLLYTAYYYVQILVHRPYIPATPFTVSLPGAHPSLAICTNAARSCARIFDAQDQAGILLNPNALPVVFTAGIVLLLHAWSKKRSGFADTSSNELENICLKVATTAEERYRPAGRYKDILSRLMHAGDTLNVDFLLELNPTSTAPPLAHSGHQSSICSLSREHQTLDANLETSQISWPGNANTPDYGYPHSGSASFPNAEVPYLNPGYDLEQLLNTNPEQFYADMHLDTDIMSIWSTAPSGFDVDEWSYFITDIPDAQFDHPPGQSEPYP